MNYQKKILKVSARYYKIIYVFDKSLWIVQPDIVFFFFYDCILFLSICQYL